MNDTIGYMIRRGLDLASEGRWVDVAAELYPLTDFHDLTIGDLEQAFPLARPCPPLTQKPAGPRLHPRHIHDIDSYGPSCFAVGCPRWCWSGHPMSYGEDAPDNVECRWCGILDPVCRLMWVGSRKCCPDCDHRPPEEPMMQSIWPLPNEGRTHDPSENVEEPT